ncbi:Hydrolase, alpha/beta fold family [hydrothermal vent metagenome]|uniref:Hydrolase, alpha/beta fold family n=1 Tax=hydrothermal vent metagenome TaxID=652676 RepID=A0A1W1BAC7_9ZZZZ
MQWIKEQANNNNDVKIAKKLNKLTLPPKNVDEKTWNRYGILHRKYLMKYGGSFHQKASFLKIFIDFLFASEYTIKDKIKFIPTALYSLRKLWLDVISINLFFEIKKADMPVYIFQGKYDYQVSTQLAKKFIEQLEAPKKEIFIFDNSAHSPNVEEYKQFNKIVIGLISKKSNKTLGDE